VAHRWLAEPNAGCGACDAAISEQGIESHEQVQIEASEISVIDAHD
jgi:hypothetical protein